jgi:hypothetical protein
LLRGAEGSPIAARNRFVGSADLEWLQLQLAVCCDLLFAGGRTILGSQSTCAGSSGSRLVCRAKPAEGSLAHGWRETARVAWILFGAWL